jgi:hypothetical protein
VFDRIAMAKPVAIAMPSSPSQSPKSPMITHRMAVTVGHGDSTASTGAKKKPRPTYHAEPARSDTSTKCSHRGIGRSAGGVLAIAAPLCLLDTIHGAAPR